MVYVLIVLGVALLITALFADQESNGTIGTALAGVVLLVLAAFRVTGITGPALTAVIGFLIGIVLTITAFSADDFGASQLVLVVCGAATFIVSFASLGASRRPGEGGEEPTPGVENI
jgi:membrane-bound ClpP family serine protease